MPPGTAVPFQVQGLEAGLLRLDYAGVPVLGPLPVSAGQFSGSFVVPGDRPVPLGPTTVAAANLVNGRLAGVAQAAFTPDVPPAPVEYHLGELHMGGTLIEPGVPLNVTGSIVPSPPAGSTR